MSRRITIVGGGIGGLTAALSLYRAGFHPVVFDSAREIRPVGVGINLLPHAVRELTELGLGEGLADLGVEPDELLYCDRSGNEIWRERLGRGAGHVWPQYSMHRGQLQTTLLLGAVRRRLGDAAVRTGLAFRRFEQVGDQVVAYFLDRRSGETVVELSDLLVGADGIDSAVRAHLYPHEGPARWNGIHMLRGVAHCPPILGGRTIVVAGTQPGDKFIAYPISPAKEPGGRVLMNWVLEIRHDKPVDSAEMPGGRVPVADALPHAASWDIPWVSLSDLIRDSAETVEFPMLDRDPLPKWSFGRVTLLGDAAHPMFPMGMNGGSQSIVDGRVLAWCLANSPDVVAALEAYDEHRRDPLNQLVLANRDLGPEKMLALVGQRAPGGFRDVDDVMSRAERVAIADGYKRLSGTEPVMLRRRGSWSVPADSPDHNRG